jgi:hypothetical protein
MWFDLQIDPDLTCLEGKDWDADPCDVPYQVLMPLLSKIVIPASYLLVSWPSRKLASPPRPLLRSKPFNFD